MNKQELFQLVNESAPEIVGRTALAVAEMERDSPDAFNETLLNFHSIAERALQGVEKHAGVLSTAVSTAKQVATSDFSKRMGLAASAALGIAVATDLYDAAKRGLSKGGNFKRVMDANPDLKRQVDDPKKLYTSFDTLHRFAPDLAADPMLGGALLLRLAKAPAEMAPEMIQNMINARKNLVDTKRSQFGMSAGLGKILGGRD